jgi:hypothetical protein
MTLKRLEKFAFFTGLPFHTFSPNVRKYVSISLRKDKAKRTPITGPEGPIE